MIAGAVIYTYVNFDPFRIHHKVFNKNPLID